MSLKRIFSFCLFLLSISAFAQLSNQARISVLTCATGTETYSVFGHTAIRVRDSVKQLDDVYNYGTFDFKTPNFYVKFLRGQLNYTLSISSFEGFMEDYQVENRAVWEQVLNLDSVQKNRLYILLEENHHPENRNYKYDFFLDNCATRVRDIIELAINKGMLFDTTSTDKTFRKCIQSCLAVSPWTRLGCNIVLGQRTDAPIQKRDLAFLPKELEWQLNHIQVDGSPLIFPIKTIFQPHQTAIKNTWFTPFFFNCLLLAAGVGLALFEFRRKRKTCLFDTILFLFCGLIGIVITFMWFFTDHSSTAYNINYLWTNPLWWLLLSKTIRGNKKVIYFFMFLTITLLVISLFPHNFLAPALYPLAILLLVRLFVGLRI